MQNRTITPVDGSLICFLLDADGCMYSYLYGHCIDKIANEHHEFYNGLASKKHLSAVDLDNLCHRRNRIMQDLSLYVASLSNQRFIDQDYPDSEFYHDTILAIRDLDPALLSDIFILSNATFISHMIEACEPYDHVRLMIGSARQTSQIDDLNASCNRTGLFFLDMLALEAHLKVKLPDKQVHFNKSTLPDVFNDWELGLYFNQSIKDSKPSHPNYFEDKNKGSILYLALHTNPASKKMHLRFYDDEMHSIISFCQRELSNYPELLPNNCTLSLTQYDGMTFNENPSIVGTGTVDPNFRKSIKKIANLYADLHHKSTFFSKDPLLPIYLSLCHHRKLRAADNLSTHVKDDFVCPFSCRIS